MSNASHAVKTESQPETSPDLFFCERVREAAEKLMHGLSVGIEYLGARDNAEQHLEHTGFAGLIGFGGDLLRGGLVLYLAEELVTKSRPETGTGPQAVEAALRDWTAELANQLLGRVKNILLRYNVKVALGVPTAVSGQGYTLTSIGDNHPRMLRFHTEHGALNILVNLEYSPELKFEEHEDGDDAAEEGDLMLF